MADSAAAVEKIPAALNDLSRAEKLTMSKEEVGEEVGKDDEEELRVKWEPWTIPNPSVHVRTFTTRQRFFKKSPYTGERPSAGPPDLMRRLEHDCFCSVKNI